jgi:hypothetical protein
MENKKVKGFRIENLHSLWSKFWGSKDDAKESQSSDTGSGSSQAQGDGGKKSHKPGVQGMKDLTDVKEENVDDKNLWEKMIKPPKKK